MGLKKHLDLKIVFLVLYVFGFLGYLLYGLLPAEASRYPVDSYLIIPSINLSSDVSLVEPVDGNLPTPETTVGSYSTDTNKKFLFGHSSTIFSDLDKVKIGDELIYADTYYRITSYNVYEKSDVNMSQILSSSSRKSLVLMTCAGEDYGNGDSSHRLIISAISL